MPKMRMPIGTDLSVLDIERIHAEISAKAFRPRMQEHAGRWAGVVDDMKLLLDWRKKNPSVTHIPIHPTQGVELSSNLVAHRKALSVCSRPACLHTRTKTKGVHYY